MQALLTVLAFLVSNRAAIKDLILHVQDLIPDAPGADKAALVKSWIGAAIGAEAQVESVWPLVSPLFNLIVAAVKKPAV